MSDRTHVFIERPDGTRIHSVAEGAGPTVVLAHGYLLDLISYELVAQRLVAAGRRVISFDQRGHGQSTIGADGLGPAALASDYRALLEHYAVVDGTLVAHSMGAFVAISLCLREPRVVADHLRRLVLVGGNAGAVAVGSLLNQLQIPLLKAGLLRPLWRWPPTGRVLARQLFGAQPDPRLVESTRLMLLRQREQQTLPMLHAMLNENHYGRLAAIPIETRVICGDRDRTCPSWHSRRLGAELPRATTVWLRGIGHMVSYEAPEAIVEAVLAG